MTEIAGLGVSPPAARWPRLSFEILDALLQDLTLAQPRIRLACA
jgi:hypothetical protein